MANVLERQAARYLKGHNAKQFILGSSTDELKTLFSKATTEKYRFQQAIDGVMHGAREMDDLRLLPKQVRHDLTGVACFFFVCLFYVFLLFVEKVWA
jgi:hypothetical protein